VFRAVDVTVRAPVEILPHNCNRQTIHEEVNSGNEHCKQSELHNRGPRKELVDQIRPHGRASLRSHAGASAESGQSHCRSTLKWPQVTPMASPSASGELHFAPTLARIIRPCNAGKDRPLAVDHSPPPVCPKLLGALYLRRKFAMPVGATRPRGEAEIVEPEKGSQIGSAREIGTRPIQT
jgi:hypothetical protein